MKCEIRTKVFGRLMTRIKNDVGRNSNMKAFLDSMIYLHYRSIEEIDLRPIIGTDDITIVIPRVTLHDLDKQKNTHRSSKVRDRARRILKKIEQWMSGQAPVRQGVSVEFFPVAPTIDYQKYGLNPQWSDDVLIASILEYSRTHTGEETVLITQDSSPRMIARQLGIAVAELPEEMKLPEEPDPLEVENRELSKKLERLQNALPQLTLCFAGSNEPETHAHFLLSPPPDTMENEITRKINDLRSKLPKQYPSPPKTPSTGPHDSLAALSELYAAVASFGPIPPEEYDRYNRDVDEYLAEYEQYMRETWEQNAALRRTIRFEIEIRNTGSAPADDVDVMLHFPDGFSLMSKDDPPNLPKEPRPPRKPRSRMEMLTDSIGHIPNLTMPFPSIPNFKVPTSFTIKRTGSYTVTDHFKRIKHGASDQLPELFLTFDSYESAKSFHCDYTVRPANLPEPVEGELHFVIEKGNANKAMDSDKE